MGERCRGTRWLVMILFVCLLTVPPAVSRADEATTLTIATYNFENFTDVFDDPYTTDEDTPVKARADIEGLAKRLREINADVVGVTEIENEGVLRAMVGEFLPDLNYQYFMVLPGNSNRGVGVGIMSRKPILSMTSYRYLDLKLPDEARVWRFGRDLLRVTVQATEEKTVDIFVVHFKSRRSSAGDANSEKWRLAEATMTRKIVGEILTRDAGAMVAVVGDFNDTPESPAMKLFTENAGGDGVKLLDVHASLPPDQRITYLNAPYRSTIDYILTSPSLGARLIAGSEKVYNTGETTGTDHAAIVAAFELGK